MNAARIDDSLYRTVTSRPAQEKNRLREAMAYYLELSILDLIGSDGIDSTTAKACILEEKESLHRYYYRLWDSNHRSSLRGPWWFDESVVTLCVDGTKASNRKRQEAFRAALAVSKDWSALDRLSRFEVFGSIAVPAISGVGKAKRYYSPGALGRAVEDGRKLDREHYWRKSSTVLPGGEIQFYLPFLPVTLIKPVRFVVNS